MAKKESRGLPPDFDLKLPDKPVELGDYLDEEAAAPPPPALAPPAPTPVAQPILQRTYVPPPPPMRAAAIPRKQLNATPETMRMLDELLLQIRQQSMEKDVRASELFHAMVLCVYEARSSLDLSTIPPRGRWGSPSAASLPVALKNAFMDAIGRARSHR